MSNVVAEAPPLSPHPHLREYYSGPVEKQRFLRNIFDATADDYDRVENLLALGTGRWYRRQALKRAGLQRGMRVLDVASGTGLVAREALAIVDHTGCVVGVDPSAGMLRHSRSLTTLRAVLGVGESLPFADRSFDFVVMGYALRHLPDLHTGFEEFHRVLHAGGKLCLLEISRPVGAISQRLLGAYFQILLPIFARVTTASHETQRLWRYYWETIDRCISPDAVMGALRDAGFDDVRRHVSLGIFSEFIAISGG